MADLKNLKNQILDELIKITDSADLDPIERFDLTMTQYANSDDQSLLATAFKAAQQIEDVAPRGTAFMQLLEEIEIAQADQSVEPEKNEAPQETHTEV